MNPTPDSIWSPTLEKCDELGLLKKKYLEYKD